MNKQIVDQHRTLEHTLEHRVFKMKIFVGLHSSKNSKCTISYLVNRTGTENAVNLTGAPTI